MPSLMAVLGLDSRMFHHELRLSKLQAMKEGKEIGSALSVKPEIGGEVKSGAVRESLVLIREIARGNWSRVPGSLSLLLQQSGKLGLVLNPVTGIVVGLAAGFFAAYKLASALTEKLSGLKVPDMHADYIAKHLQKANMAAEAQKEINREVEKTRDLYDSAAKSAERLAEATKEHFSHQRKMNEFAMEKELELAKSEKERQEIRKKFSAKALQLDAQERQQTINNKIQEQHALVDEYEKRKKQGDSVVVNSKEHDRQIVEQRKKMAEEAQKYLDDLAASKNSMGGKAKDALIRGYNSVALSGVSGADLDAAEKANKEEAHRRIQSAKDAVDQEAANDELRKKKDNLYKQAGESASKAAELSKALPDMMKETAQKNKDESEEAAAKLDAENSKKQQHAGRPDVNALQKIGAFVGHDPQLDIHKQNARHLQSIATDMKTMVQRQGRGVHHE